MSEAVQETLPDPISSQIESPIDTGSDEANIRQAMRESQKRREETGQDSGFDDAGADTRARPHEWSGAGLISEKDSTREALQKAATHQTDTRKLEMGRAYLAATGAQPDDDFAYRGADLAAQMGRKPSELPTQKALTADRYGNVLEPIGDMDRRLWERDDVVANVREGTRIRAQGREPMPAAEEAQIAEAEQAAREAEYQRLEGTQSPEVQGQSPTVGEPSVAVATATDQPVTQPQAAAPDPLAQERAALQQQYNEAALQG